MIEILDYAFPSPEQWLLAISGMRNAFKSTNKCDSEAVGEDIFILGEKDRKLLNNLISEGDPSHRKVLRQLPITLEIKAPLYWWKQADKYQIGTVTNSESTMHTLLKEPFSLSDFSTDGWYDGRVPLRDIQIQISKETNEAEYEVQLSQPTGINIFNYFIIDILNIYRDYYLETKNEEVWRMINGLLPQSYNQIRTWTGNYEVLRNMYHQREGHKLQEWKDFRDWIEDHVPYAEDLIVRKE